MDVLLRVAIYVTEDKKYLFTDFHHIIADGNSYDIIFEDINKAYMGEKLEKSPIQDLMRPLTKSSR